LRVSGDGPLRAVSSRRLLAGDVPTGVEASALADPDRMAFRAAPVGGTEEDFVDAAEAVPADFADLGAAGRRSLVSPDAVPPGRRSSVEDSVRGVFPSGRVDGTDVVGAEPAATWPFRGGVVGAAGLVPRVVPTSDFEVAGFGLCLASVEGFESLSAAAAGAEPTLVASAVEAPDRGLRVRRASEPSRLSELSRPSAPAFDD
jgi:hypothetical protein